MAAKWNLRNYEIFAHRGYYGDNTIAGFEKCVEKGYHIESDSVQTADGTVFMSHDRQTTDTAGNTIYVANMTDAEFRSYWPNAPTFQEFAVFMQANPDTLVYFDPYGGLDALLPIAKNAGILDRIMISTPQTTSAYIEQYPELSYGHNGATIVSDVELDGLRTPQNIVSVIGRDNADGAFFISMAWYQLDASTLADAVANGATWFCPAVNGTHLDEFAEALKEYTAPGYAQTEMLTQVGDAIRSKTGGTNEIYARNFPSQIRKMTTVAADAVAESLEITVVQANYAPSFRGYVPLEKITVDMAGFNGMPGTSFFAMAGASGGKIIVKNCADGASINDLLRNAINIAEIEFEGGVYPSGTISRVCQYVGYDTPLLSICEQNIDTVTVKGIHLDNVTSFSNVGSGASLNLNILWEGTLTVDVTANSAKYTAASINNLVSCLADYSGGEAHTLTIGATNLAKVTDENKALAAARNWTLV